MARSAYWLYKNGFSEDDGEGAGTNLKEARALALAWYPKARFITITRIPFDKEGYPIPDEEDPIGEVYPAKMVWEDGWDRKFRLHKDGSLGRRI